MWNFPIIYVDPGSYSSIGRTDENIAVIACLVNGSIKNYVDTEEISAYIKTTLEAKELISDKVSGRMPMFLTGICFHINES